MQSNKIWQYTKEVLQAYNANATPLNIYIFILQT